MLRYIIEKRNAGSLGFYNVFLSGFRKIIFPEMVGAFQDFPRRVNGRRLESQGRRIQECLGLC